MFVTGMAAPGASSTTWTPTGCTASTAGAGVAHRRRDPASRPVRLGRQRRRRRAVDRRQPPDPRAAAQRAAQDPALQQPDLRPHEGPVLPTSEEGRSRSRPRSAPRTTLNSVSLALGAEASFVARTVDTDKAHVAETLRAAAQHEGAALVEIYQNCNVFNDGAFDAVRAKGQKDQNQIRLVHGEPIRFGADGSALRRAAPADAWSWSTSAT